MRERKRENEESVLKEDAPARDLHPVGSGGALVDTEPVAEPADREVDPRTLTKESEAIHRWCAETSKMAEAFERRWTWRALKRVNADLAEALQDQRDLWDRAKIIGGLVDIETQGAAMCRGYAAAVAAMEAAKEPDDAYVLGFDPSTGTRVAVGEKICAAKRVAEIHGEKHVWITPDEVASMFAALQGVEAISAIKREFPGAEMVSIYPADPPAEAAE